MLTALIIKDEKPQNRFEKLINLIRGDRIITEIKSSGSVVLRLVTYIGRNGKINSDRISAVLGETSEILCARNMFLPEGYERFENDEFKSRLSVNLGAFLLKKLRKTCPDLNVGYYDPEAVERDGTDALSRYNDNLTVVTDKTEMYDEVCERIQHDSGAVVSVTCNRERLRDCGIVIAPSVVREPLPLRADAVVLTSARPEACLSCMCLYDYDFRMPNTFANLKPPCFSAEYFSGALYSLACQYELGSIVPTSCSDSAGSHTPASLLEYIGGAVAC